MIMENDGAGEKYLEELFAATRAELIEPGAELSARVLAHAMAEQPQRSAAAAAPSQLWQGLAHVLGGALGLGGLGAATALGLVIGLTGVVDLPSLATEDALDLAQDVDGLFSQSLTEE